MTEDTQGEKTPGEESDATMSADAVNILSSTSGARAVTTALKRAADATGVGFDVLYNMAQRESSLNPDAKAKTSSAAGLFQFIDQTWLGAVKKYGAAHGLEEQAASITQNAKGRYVVADAQKREEILNLRFDPSTASALAGELIQENTTALENKLGRAVNSVDVYAAHFLGANGAARLLSASSDDTAATILPKAASANRNVFYDGARAKTVGEVIASIGASMNTAAEAPAATPALETKSFPSLRENLFAAVQNMRSSGVYSAGSVTLASAPSAAQPAASEESAEAAAPGAYAIFSQLRNEPLPSIAFSALASIDPTRLGESRNES
ncbi:MAG TPA: transglycosylase SLT domain-containing protein [Parvularculaceae bacterium]|nr:transglycosylase SLT domain-containing protein [Amphiplicatus sp.]MCB9954614.1 transglycosylase SLT domain-containing protein [Caulobacterales bacterium]HPE33153.1 transglycosylase SLT domain-containing protein [Parvularculaceae bacterium]